MNTCYVKFTDITGTELRAGDKISWLGQEGVIEEIRLHLLPHDMMTCSALVRPINERTWRSPRIRLDCTGGKVNAIKL